MADKNRLKFAANVSLLFTEFQNLPRRYIAAKRSGFEGVECCNPYEDAIHILLEAKNDAKVEQVLLDAFKGDTMGLAAVPNRLEEFRQCLELSIQYCTALACKRLHVMAGVYPEEEMTNPESISLWDETYVNNLRYAAQRCLGEGITILIEPIPDIDNYFLRRTDQAIDILQRVDASNVKLLVDIQHHHISEGQMTESLSDLMPYIGHIQISNGNDDNDDTNCTAVFNQLLRLNYSGWIGCEYKPSGSSSDGFGWLEPYLQPFD